MDTKEAHINLHLVFFLCAVSLLLLHSLFYAQFAPDDAYISFRYAQRFASLGELNWNDGEYVEGYTNFLWVILLSLGSLAGLDLLGTSRVIGIICMAGVIGSLISVPRYRAESTAGIPVYAVGIISFTICGLTAAWSMGGLEQPLVALLLALLIRDAFAFSERGELRFVIRCTIWGGLLSLTRPDGLLFSAAVAAWLLFSPFPLRPRVKPAFGFGVVVLIVFGMHTLFRWYYYGDLVPNTAHVKLPFSSLYLEKGVLYVAKGYALLFPLLLPFAGLVLQGWLYTRAHSASSRTHLIILLLVFWTLYVISIGGDVNPPSRHFVPVLVILVWGCCEYFSFWLEADASHWFQSLHKEHIVWVVGLLLLFSFLQWADRELRDARGSHEYNSAEIASVGNLLRGAFGHKRPLVALDGAGAVPFYSGLPTLDLLGLNDAHIAKNPPQSFGTGWLGHELGDAEYVLRRMPDLILFGSYEGEWDGSFREGKKLVAHPQFKKDYQKGYLLSTTVPPFPIQVWIRERGVLGIEGGSTEVKYPGYLISVSPNGSSNELVPTSAVFAPNGRAVFGKHVREGDVVTVQIPGDRDLSKFRSLQLVGCENNARRGFTTPSANTVSRTIEGEEGCVLLGATVTFQ